MEQLQTLITVAQLPTVVLLTIAIFFLWKDYLRIQAEAKAERAQLLDRLESVYNRVLKVENHLGIDDPPTIPKRPE